MYEGEKNNNRWLDDACLPDYIISHFDNVTFHSKKITFYGFNDEVIGSAIFGRSSSDWQRSYVRMVDGNEVYMTNENVLNRLQMRPTFWGSKPPPVSVEPDSL